MRARWLPWAWRYGRRIYRADYPQGRWVNIMSTGTLAALSRHLEEELAELGDTGGLTVAHVAANDRAVTTLLAHWLRDTATSFDGAQPLGSPFSSKHGHPAGGTGTCWAYWMRAIDAGLDEPGTATDKSPINEHDVDLKTPQEFRIIQTR
jgi:hypothetical protein